MDLAYILGMVFGVLAPVTLVAACVFEGRSFRLLKDPRHNKQKLAGIQKTADILLVAAWLLLAAAYLAHNLLSCGAENVLFAKHMTWVLGALLLADIYYLYLRRARPRKPGQKKHFWEI